MVVGGGDDTVERKCICFAPSMSDRILAIGSPRCHQPIALYGVGCGAGMLGRRPTRRAEIAIRFRGARSIPFQGDNGERQFLQ